MKLSQVKSVTDRVGAVIDYLKTQPKDEIFTSRELEEKLGFRISGRNTFLRARSTRLKAYYALTAMPGQHSVCVYGNPAAIKALRAQIGDSDEGK